MNAHSRDYLFDINGLIKTAVSGPALLTGPVALELQNYFVKERTGEKPDLIVNLRYLGQWPGAAPGDGNRPHAWEGKHLIARWKAQWTDSSSGPPSLDFYGNLASRFIVSKWIVEPAIRVVLAGKGISMTHAAAVSDGKKALLISGEGGAGKTTFVLDWLAAGHPYSSDDFSIIDRDKIMPYVTPMRLGAMNLIMNRTLSSLPARDKAEIFIRTAVRRALFKKVKLYYKGNPAEIIPRYEPSPPVPIGGAVILSRSGPGKIEKVSPESISETMKKVDVEESHGFGQTYPGPAEKGPLSADYWDRHRERLFKVLAGKPCFRVSNFKPPAKVLASVDELIAWLEKS